jgi:hypothetical protein
MRNCRAPLLILLTWGTALFLGCRNEIKPSIAVGIDGCAACGMVISEERQAAGFVADDEFRPFCSSGCLLDAYDRRRKADKPTAEDLVFGDYSGEGLQSATSARFLFTNRIPTVMDWGFLAFSNAEQAERYRHEGELVTDWMGVRRLRGDPDRTLSLLFTTGGMHPEVLPLEKGELVVLEMRAEGFDEELRLRIRGYEELDEIVLAPSGEVLAVRVLATRPGEGFPVTRVDDGRAMGRIRVAGLHTPIEEDL